MREMSQILDVSTSTILRHLQSIGKVKNLNKIAPHEFNDHSKFKRFEDCSMLCVHNANNSLHDWIVTCDKKWILYNNRKKSGQWLDCDESSKHFPKPKLHQQKIMVTVKWSAINVIHYSFLETNQHITAKFYYN